MNFKKVILVAFLATAFAETEAQGLYMPRDIKAAYKKETRSPNGKPGKNYWQNRAKYNITITAIPPDRNIKGTEKIVYYNNSPDTLKALNIKMIMNIHKPGATRSLPASEEYLATGIKIDRFLAGGQSVSYTNTSPSTNKIIKLPSALLPKDSVVLDIDWHFQLSVESGREGMLDPTTYFLAYFYPRVSVYDDYAGWDNIEFIDRQEFYNDFNDYVLNVKVPKNFVVWATGTLQNTREVLQPEYAKRLEKSYTSDATIRIATPKDYEKKNITAQNELNTWTWTADNISDVTFALSDHYNWDGASVVVDPKTRRRASMQAVYADSAADFHQAVQFGRQSLRLLSNTWPGIPYPFPKMTTVMGLADMEYPMMCNDSHNDDPDFTRFIQDHEIAHTYMPFYMGINETRYAFMDEGWATTFEYLIGQLISGKPKADSLYKKFRVERWIHSTATHQDLPVITPSNELTRGYGNNAYVKPSLSYLALKDMLGDDLFKKSLHGFMDRWNGKHPIPWDFFNSMSDVSGRDLTWFFNNWFFSNHYIDLSVENGTKTNNGYTINVQNLGGFAIPFDVKVTFTDGTTQTLHQTPAVWQANQKKVSVTVPTAKNIKTVIIDGGIFLDADTSNNSFTM
ncbi:M1 family peptidase [Mucilaginibacter hurinus]|uniref:M1 family peptidase n=1 Tax=Mucilaginibacter hurinus TaxID=2201324 RepID=A0A367GU79_9SPHI|nr:M1 family metallopeptidase [Mucilaginibacter hurinus]RCH56386.1 M1 family peptidase [Mucilaginibacter hurinus]